MPLGHHTAWVCEAKHSIENLQFMLTCLTFIEWCNKLTFLDGSRDSCYYAHMHNSNPLLLLSKTSSHSMVAYTVVGVQQDLLN